MEYLVYNKNDQVVLTQDANQRVRKEWTYTRYDAFSRVTTSGLYTNTAKLTRADVSALVDAATGPLWETRTGADYPALATTFPLAGTGITVMPHVVNYYDDYTFIGAEALPASAVTKSTMIKSLQTGTKVYRTDGTAPLLTVMYYDDYGRVIQTASQNHLEGKDYVTNTYNFPGELLSSTRVHTSKTGTATTIVTTNNYDHVGRLISTKEKIGAQAEVTLASNSYNEIGQLKGTAVGKSGSETAFVNTTTYSYNERGWLSKSISPRFSQQLWGDDATFPNTFSYSYDKLNRLLSGTNGQTGTGSIAETMTYDDMGNIKTLKRDALTATTYTYVGNRLTGLSGGLTGTYTYDVNGNAKTDRMGIALTYNYLNLLQTAKKAGTDVTFLYNAAGQKLQKISISKIGTTSIVTTTRDYVGGIEYNNGAIDIIHNSAGYAQRNGTNYVYHYNLTDHLGNVRATLKRGASATAVDVVQRDNYYPFGKRKVVAGGNNKYLYNGKEIQGELGDQYDYGARYYDAEIGRWNVVDPLAEKMRRHSPYNYAFDNPIMFIDPDGRESTGWIKSKRSDGSATYTYDATINSQEQLDAALPNSGKTYVGENFTLASYTNGVADGSYKYTFNGTSAMDINGNNVDLTGNLTTPLGSTVVDPTNTSGTYSGISIGGAVGGGISLQAGVVTDNFGDKGLYFTFGGHAGFGGGIGVSSGIATPSNNQTFSVSDFAGEGNSVSVGLGIGPLAVGGSYGGSKGNGFGDFGNPTKETTRSYYSYGGGQSSQYPSGLSFKMGAGITGGVTVDRTKTWVLKF